MPEDERSGDFDPDEDYPWDCDLPYPVDGVFEAEED